MEQISQFSIVKVQGQSTSDDEAQFRTETATFFQSFMAALMKRRPLTVSTVAGSAEWGGLPVEEIVAYGLWAVMLRVSEVYGLVMSTESNVINDVAPRINRMLNVGLILTYATPEEAADAFEAQMRHAILLESTHENLGKVMAFQDLVQLSAAQFFGSLIKQTRDFVQKLEFRIFRVKKINDPQRMMIGLNDTPTCGYVDDGRIESFIALINALDPRRELPKPSLYARLMGDLSSEPFYKLVPHAIARLDALAKQISLLSHTPLKLGAMPEGVRYEAVSIEDVWIRTQLALAAIDAPDRDYLDMVELEPAVTAIQASDDQTIVDKFIARMRGRGVRAESDLDRLLVELAEDKIESVRSSSEQIDLNTTSSYFINIRVDKLELSPEQSLQMATDSMAIVGVIPDETSDFQISQTVSKNMAWNQLSLDDFKSILEKGEISDRDMAQGIAKMSSDIRLQATQLLYDHHEADPGLLGLIIDVNDPATPIGLVERYISYAPPSKVLPVVIRRLVKEFDRNGFESLETKRITALIRGLERLPISKARQLFNEPEMRQLFNGFVVVVLRDPFNVMEYGLDHLQGEILINRLGRQTYNRYALASEMLLRQGVYQTGHDSEVDSEIAAIRFKQWHELATAEEPHVIIPLIEVLRATPDEVAQILEEYPEDEIFRWFYAANKNMSKMLLRFRKERTAYYARWDAKDSRRKTSKSVTKSTKKTSVKKAVSTKNKTSSR